MSFSGTSDLHRAKRNKDDDFYTQLTDIEKEVKHLPKNLNKFNKLFNKKNISRKNCVLMPLIALKKLSIDE